MLGEKKSLALFLGIYFFSMIMVVGVFDWLYIKNISFQIEKEQKEIVKEKLLSNDLRFQFWNNNFYDINVTIYRNNELLKKSPQKGVCINYPIIRGWGRFHIIACRVFSDEMKPIIKKLIIYNVLFLAFIMIIAYFLGKLFLSPLKRELETLEEFMRDATHEMQTPIAIINSNIEMLELKGIENKEFNRIKNAAKRLSKIFEDLKFIRITHKMKKNINKLDFREILTERIKFFETQLENKKLKLNLILKNVEIEADREDMIKIIDNLLSNAIKYSPKNGEVGILLNEKFFEIQNVGEIKNIKKITSKFYRENRSEGGFGLGLYIVKKICESYGFGFEIESKNNKVRIRVYI